MATVPVANCKHWQAAVLVPNGCRAGCVSRRTNKMAFHRNALQSGKRERLL